MDKNEWNVRKIVFDKFLVEEKKLYKNLIFYVLK